MSRICIDCDFWKLIIGAIGYCEVTGERTSSHVECIRGFDECALCNRKTPEEYREKHHLIPRCKNGKQVIPVCIDCGNQVHQLFTIRELRDVYNTVEVLKNHEGMQKWIRWIRKQKSFGVCHKEKKRR